jgi:hypothetical protein
MTDLKTKAIPTQDAINAFGRELHEMSHLKTILGEIEWAELYKLPMDILTYRVTCTKLCFHFQLVTAH